MTRLLLNFLTVLSLLLFVAAVVMWVRSYRAYDALGHWYRRTDSREFGRLVEETRLVVRFRGVESAGGSIGAGAYAWKHAKRSPAIFALEWEPVPDEDFVAVRRKNPAGRPTGVPFHAAGSRADGGVGVLADRRGGRGRRCGPRRQRGRRPLLGARRCRRGAAGGARAAPGEARPPPAPRPVHALRVRPAG